MKKNYVLMIAMIILTGLTYSQGASDIYGTVMLQDGSAIPGVAVTLTSNVIGARTAVTSEEGNYRFLALPPGTYALKFELDGFKTVNQTNIRLFATKNQTINITLDTTTVKEEITISGTTTVVDTRKVNIGVNISGEQLRALPTARNPWTILNLVPGMMMDRADVGGNESGQQSAFYGNGASDKDTTWNVDGGNITDPSAIGSAPAYLNVNNYEEMQVNVGANDITSQTGGTQINFISKRAGNQFSGDFHLNVEDEKWEMSQTLPQVMIDAGRLSPGINRLYQYGFGFGGPIVKDKLWFYGSYGIQDIDARKTNGTSDKSWLQSGYAKLNFQMGKFAGEFAYSNDSKKKWGRSVNGDGLEDNDCVHDQDGPGSFYRGSLQFTNGALMLSLRGVYSNGGFSLNPRGSAWNEATQMEEGNESVNFENPSEWHQGSSYTYFTNRNSTNLGIDGNYFLEGALGADHEIKFGVDYYDATTTTVSAYPNQRWCFIYDKANPTSNDPDNPNYIQFLTNNTIDVGFRRISLYASDTATFGKLTAQLGIRYDKETGSHNGMSGKGVYFNGSLLFPHYLPDLQVESRDCDASFNVISPRLSLAYDLTGDGRNLIKLAIARYGSQSGNYIAANTWVLGQRYIMLPWNDANGNLQVEAGEFDPSLPMEDWLGYNGFDPTDPSALISSSTYASDLNSPLLDEVTLSYERAIGSDIGISITGYYKKRHHDVWYRNILLDGSLETIDNWEVGGTLNFPDGSSKDYYVYKQSYIGTCMSNYKESYQRYLALQLVFSKKLANRWMLEASLSLQDYKAFWDRNEFMGNAMSPGGAWFQVTCDPTNYDFYNEGAVAPQSGGSGLSDIFVNSRWDLRINGLYQLPGDINLSAVFLAREGYVIPYYITYTRPGLADDNRFYEPGKKLGDDRLPTFWMINLGLEKTFNVSEKTSFTLFADGYNITNNKMNMAVSAKLGSSATGQAIRILNPGLFQFGVRVNF